MKASQGENFTCVQEIIRRFAFGAIGTIETTLRLVGTKEYVEMLFQLRALAIAIEAKLSNEPMAIATLDTISEGLLGAIQTCAEIRLLEAKTNPKLIIH